jgi:putative N6-adenine-specific DNA methylase
MMVVNPPYGERLVLENLLNIYKELGARLKHSFQGNEAWVISSSYDCFDQIGLKASARIPLYNGDLDCEFRKYEMFQGKYKGFRDEGNALKKDFAPLKRKSRLTGLDGEQRPSRKEREADNFSSEIDSDSMRRRRELESYFDSYKSRKAAPRRKSEDEGKGERRADNRGERREKPFANDRPRKFEGDKRGDFRQGARDNRKNDDSRKPYARGGKPERKESNRKQGDFKPLRGGKRKDFNRN